MRAYSGNRKRYRVKSESNLFTAALNKLANSLDAQRKDKVHWASLALSRRMPIQDNSLFRRLHQHAQKRLIFDPGVSRSKQLPAYKRYVELENVMLERMHRKGESGLRCVKRAPR